MKRASNTRARAKRSKTARTTPASSSGTPALATKLANALHVIARDLTNPASESSDLFRPFAAPLSPDVKLDAGTFQQALEIGGRFKIDLSPADDLLAGAVDPDNSGDEAEGFRLLEKVMRVTLSELSVAFARGHNVVRVRMWLFGRSADGSLVGLRSMSTET